jgi:peptide deformylase
MISRIFQHEHDHMLGRLFTERASKLKLKRANIYAKKQIKKLSNGKA